MDVFENYKKEKCLLPDEQKEHILQRHPEATMELISNCLSDPFEMRKSITNNISHLYYINKNKGRFFVLF